MFSFSLSFSLRTTALLCSVEFRNLFRKLSFDLWLLALKTTWVSMYTQILMFLLTSFHSPYSFKVVSGGLLNGIEIISSISAMVHCYYWQIYLVIVFSGTKRILNFVNDSVSIVSRDTKGCCLYSTYKDKSLSTFCFILYCTKFVVVWLFSLEWAY